MDLFAAPESVKNRGLDAVVDRIRGRFGSVAVKRASTLAGPSGAGPRKR
jgi:hypothetical protein